MRIEETILRNLIYNEEYALKVIPFLKTEYFSRPSDVILFNEIEKFITNYKSLPTKEALIIGIGDKRGLDDEIIRDVRSVVDESKFDPNTDIKWLVDSTEKYCQDIALYNAIRGAVEIMDGKNSKLDRGAIPQLLNEALGVTFDTNIGHDYTEDSMQRFDEYHSLKRRVPFDLEVMNKITGGGFLEKTLNLYMAGPKVGKSLVMCHHAAGYLLQGFDVLYITLEMAEERIAERIDANLLDIAMSDVSKVGKDILEKKMCKLRTKTQGRLVIKEYPTSTASVIHFRALLNELRLKKNFKPHVIIIDYLNICCSARISMGGNAGSYAYIKSIAEEIRGLAVEFEVPIISATQINRAGSTSGDPGMDDVSESFGVPATVDFLCAIVNNEELAKLGQFLFVQVASRYGDINYYRKFVVGVDKRKMRLYDTEDSSQEGMVEAGYTEKERKVSMKEKFGKLKVN